MFEDSCASQGGGGVLMGQNSADSENLRKTTKISEHRSSFPDISTLAFS
jgi:hypothetical protein